VHLGSILKAMTGTSFVDIIPWLGSKREKACALL